MLRDAGPSTTGGRVLRAAGHRHGPGNRASEVVRVGDRGLWIPYEDTVPAAGATQEPVRLDLTLGVAF